MERKDIKGKAPAKIASSYEVRRESRNKVMNDVVSSADSATRFLKSVGILNRNGNLSENYNPKR